jgi:hypothetical protein
MHAHPLPSLFGRFTAIVAVHESLSRTLARLRELCDALDAGVETLAWRLKPPTLALDLEEELLTHFAVEEADVYFGTIALDLEEELLTHFAVEEADVYFGTIAHDRPDLIVAIATLRAEHAVMLSLIERLRELSTDPEHWHDLVAPARVLLSMFETHEHAEARLIEGFLTAEPS